MSGTHANPFFPPLPSEGCLCCPGSHEMFCLHAWRCKLVRNWLGSRFSTARLESCNLTPPSCSDGFSSSVPMAFFTHFWNHLFFVFFFGSKIWILQIIFKISWNRLTHSVLNLVTALFSFSLRQLLGWEAKYSIFKKQEYKSILLSLKNTWDQLMLFWLFYLYRLECWWSKISNKFTIFLALYIFMSPFVLTLFTSTHSLVPG